MPKTIKIYDNFPSNGGSSTELAALIFDQTHHTQVHAYVAAYTKAEALGYFARAGVRVTRPGEIRLGHGNNMDMFIAAELLGQPGHVVVTGSNAVRNPAVVSRPDAAPEVAGTFGFDRKINKQVFTRAADGAEFPLP